MYVEKIDVIEESPCLVEPRKFKVLAKTDKPLTDILSILYLALPASNYSKAHGSLSFLRKGRLVGLFSDGKINISCFESKREAKDNLDELKNLINKAFAYLLQHGPPDEKLIEIRGKISPLGIYKYLPGTNCRACGEQGCFLFAVKLSNGSKTLDEFPEIQKSEYRNDLERLIKMIQPIKLE